MWQECIVDQNSPTVYTSTLLQNYSTLFCVPCINDLAQENAYSIVKHYSTIGTLPIDDGPFRSAEFINSLEEYSIDSPDDLDVHYMTQSYHWDNGVSANIEKPAFIPSPYMMDFNTMSYTLNPIFDNTTASTGSTDIYQNGNLHTTVNGNVIPNMLSDFNGLSNTYQLHTLLGNQNETYAGEACYQESLRLFGAAGVSYIPGAGELAFIIPRINTINTSLKECNGVLFGYASPASLARDNEGHISSQDVYIPTTYFSSTQANDAEVIALSTFRWEDGGIGTLNGETYDDAIHNIHGGIIGGLFKFDTTVRVRPFILVRSDLSLIVCNDQTNGQPALFNY